MNENRIIKDYHFIGNTFYEDLKIDGLSILFEFIIIDNQSNKEIYIIKEDGDSFFKNPYKCFVDKEKGYVLQKQSIPCSYKNKDVTILCQPTNRATIWLDDSSPISISFDKAIDILKHCFNDFNDDDNKPAQNLFYYFIDKDKELLK